MNGSTNKTAIAEVQTMGTRAKPSAGLVIATREAAGWTKATAARELHITWRAYQRYETGERHMSRPVFELMKIRAREWLVDHHPGHRIIKRRFDTTGREIWLNES